MPNQATLHNTLSLIELSSVLQSRHFLVGLLSSTRSLIMPKLVQRKALESAEATAGSSSAAPLTTPPSNTTTPLTTVQATATAGVSTIEPPIKPHPIIDKLMKLNTSASGQPLEVSAADLCAATGVTYNKFSILLNRQYTVRQEKRVTDENNPSSDHDVRHYRFRFWIAKGAKQFTELFSKHPEFDPEKITFKTFLLDQFYLEIFPSEKEEIYKLMTDQDMWHLVLIGREQPREGNREASDSLWKIIASASFQPMNDLQTIYLSWLAVSCMKAEYGKWNPKKTKKKQPTNEDVKSFFDGTTFSNGKGIGSTMLATVQYICSSLVPAQTRSSRFYENIICQSSAQALEFYKVAMGFVEITDATTIPTDVLSRFINSRQVIPIKFTGRLNERRPPKVKQKKNILAHILRQALCNMFLVKHNIVATTIHNLPTGIQRRGSSIYYSPNEKEFLSDMLPDSVTYEEFDGLYPQA